MNTSSEIPYVLVHFDGAPVALNKAQTEQAIRDARVCGCGKCLACHVKQYVESQR